MLFVKYTGWIVCVSVFVLSGCTTMPPRNVGNICSIFKQHPEWYADTKAVEKRWHVPITTQMAIIHQESRFNARAKPERTKLLWVIPWTRPSSAYGYTQALDMTWSRYKRATGRTFASRSNFADGVDFIGWYANQAHKRAGISYGNTNALYLAYHEGVGGYQRGTYRRKRWLVHVARKVQTRAQIYDAQLKNCEAQLKRKAWHWF
ncbi:MAG: transglycosylase SLT domain-containing protein [Legionellaceae bacterium]|nr:transglycosylase SLT domain-containing protein [Legionellaceae bacterium]